MKRERVSRILYLVNSWVVKTSPFVAKLQMALLNIFKANSSSTKEQFSNKEVLSDPIMLYLLTNRPWREKFSQMTESIAKISRLREDFSSSSQSIRKTVTRNLRVKGKQNLGFSLMSSAMIESTYIIRNSVCGCCSSDSKQENIYFQVSAKRGEVIHHPPHEVDMGHENGCVSLLEEMIHAKQALFKLSPLGLSHSVSQLLHGLFCLRLFGSIFYGVDEKLYWRFLEDDGEVRGLRLS